MSCDKEATKSKVLFIGGSGRSGSTILATLLAQFPGFVSIGELSGLWDNGLLDNGPCSCRSPIRECPFWREIVQPYLAAPREEIEAIVDLRKSLLGRPFLSDVHRWIGGSVDFEHVAGRYAMILAEMYQRISQVTGSRVIVDSSKQPVHGYAIGQASGVDLYVLHLIRDPRAVAFSKQRLRVRTPDGWQPEFLPRLPPSKSALKWIAVNLKSEYFWGWRDNAPYLRLRYEDFVEQPQETLLEIRDLLNEKAPLDFFVAPHVASVGKETHQIQGNPSRFETTSLKIRADHEWSSTMPARDRVAITALTLPLLVRYGYSIQSRTPMGASSVDGR